MQTIGDTKYWNWDGFYILNSQIQKLCTGGYMIFYVDYSYYENHV